MKKLMFLMLLAPIWAVFSCNKDEIPTTTVVEGIAIEYGSNKPLVGAEIWVSEQANCSFTSQGCSYQEVVGSRVKTDANGRYRIEFAHSTTAPFATRYETRGKFESELLFGGDVVRVAEPNNFTLMLISPATLIVNVKNINQYDGRDSILLYDGFGYLNGWKNATLNKTITDNTTAHFTIRIRYRLKVNGELRPWVVDSVRLDTRETRTYNVYY